MQHGVYLCNSGVAPVHFLGKILSRIGVLAAFAQEVCRMHEHATASASGIVNRVAGVRLQDAHERVHHLRRGEKFARLRAGIICELLDQIFVGVAQHVGRHAGIGEVVSIEVLDQRVHNFVRDERLAAAIRCGLRPVHGEHAREFIIGVGNGLHRRRESFPELGRYRQHIAPAAAFRDRIAVFATRAEYCLLGVRKGPSLLAL